MKFAIRNFHPTDFETVKGWWIAAGDGFPTMERLPVNTTFVLELDDVLALCVTCYFTNCKEMAYIENFIGNPEYKGPQRKEAASQLFSFICEFAATLGYKRFICLAPNEKLKTRYQELGLTPTLSNLTALVKEF